LLCQAFLLAWSAMRHSPTVDEVAHLPAGVMHWQRGQFALYRVNPPLVKLEAALPVLFTDFQTDWRSYTEDPTVRCEFPVGEDFVAANGPDSIRLFFLARLACIPFSLIGAYTCYRWASDLYGSNAGVVALVLW